MSLARLLRVRGDGLDLQVTVMGEGPPVILLHGFPENSHCWRHQMPALAAAGFSAWAPNLRGYPPSDIPHRRGDCALPHLVRDVLGLVQATGFPRVHLVGHDWGGIVAWAFAGAHPELVERLVVLNAPHMQSFRENIWRGGQFLRSAYAGIFQLPWLPEAALSAGGFRLLRSMFGTARPGAYSAADIDWYVETLGHDGALSAALNYYRANARAGAMDMARAHVRSQTLVIWGERDPALSVRLLDGLDRYVTRLRVQRIPQAGHWVQNEAPGEVNDALLGFLREGPP
ncbi:alpha/beta fold hydrolase [Noviherbaspirillum aridicola]|uniref:Epoxide hydrolase n=1 Tax=Noviherbaspirillum aridicola TaxID=2849687 RepID=A0ABQ4Q078_9BURK|nr:alpha/beta hydrolase [Noviherbaspirillum aridicola]GIZ50170.1 epoxide hydrolase [Noviherbaspirillum aridicola]